MIDSTNCMALELYTKDIQAREGRSKWPWIHQKKKDIWIVSQAQLPWLSEQSGLIPSPLGNEAIRATKKISLIPKFTCMMVWKLVLAIPASV